MAFKCTLMTAVCLKFLNTLIKEYINLSYDVAVIQWITSCHKNRMTTRVITHWREHVTSLTTSMSQIRFYINIMFILQAIKFYKQNLTLVVISYRLYKTRRRLIS